MKKLKVLLLIIIFCFAMVGTAYAAPENLIIWDADQCTSSDDPDATYPDTIDEMTSGFTNYGDGDYASLDIISVTNDRITCTIANGYPGYQASIDAVVKNVTDYPVTITDIYFTAGNEPADCIQAILTDSEGNVIIDSDGALSSSDDKVINKGSSLQVSLVTSIKESASQMSTYTFEIQLDAQQEEVTSNKKKHYQGLVTPTPDPIVIQNFEPIVMPELPVAAPPELPNTGGDMLLLISSAAAVGGLGILFRRRK